MKYSIKQDIVDTKGNRGTIVNVSDSTSAIYYQVLFDKDWATGKAEYISKEYRCYYIACRGVRNHQDPTIDALR